jgi:hypothetical protein
MHTEVPDARAIATSIYVGIRSYAQENLEKHGVVLAEVLNRLIRANRESFDNVVAALLGTEIGDQVARLAYPLVADERLKRVCAIPWITSGVDKARTARIDLVGV